MKLSTVLLTFFIMTFDCSLMRFSRMAGDKDKIKLLLFQPKQNSRLRGGGDRKTRSWPKKRLASPTLVHTVYNLPKVAIMEEILISYIN